MGAFIASIHLTPDLEPPHGVESQIGIGLSKAFAPLGLLADLYELNVSKKFPGLIHYGEYDPKNHCIDFGWSDATGLCTILAAYAVHVVAVRAWDMHWKCSPSPVSSGRFAVIRKQIAEWHEDGFLLQKIAPTDLEFISLKESTSQEKLIWKKLQNRCMCPTCIDRAQTAEEVDALVLRVAKKDPLALKQIAKAFVQSPALIEATLKLDQKTALSLIWDLHWWDKSLAAKLGLQIIENTPGEMHVLALAAILKNHSGDRMLPQMLIPMVEKALRARREIAVYFLRLIKKTAFRDQFSEIILSILDHKENAYFASEALSVLQSSSLSAPQKLRYKAFLEQWSEDKNVQELLKKADENRPYVLKSYVRVVLFVGFLSILVLLMLYFIRG